MAAPLYVVLLHHPVYDKNGAVVATAVTNMDVHDLARIGKTFGVRGIYVATPVRAPLKAITSHQGQVTADVVTGTATMNWDEVRALVDLAGIPGIDPSQVQLSVVDDQVRLRIPLSFLGQQLTLTAAGTLTVANGKVRFQVSQLTPEGDNLPNLNGLVNQYKQRLSVTINVPALPYKLTVNKVQTSSQGVVATASADNVVLAGS